MSPVPLHRYRKLAESVRGGVWLGPDHLLVVTGPTLFLRYSERYDRFYFRDIEALVATKNPASGGITVLLVLLSLCLGMAAVASYPGTGAILWGSIAAAALVWTIVRLTNPRLLLRIQTRVGLTKGVPVPRSRVRRILTRLTPLIEAAQQDLPPLAETQPPGAPLRGAPAA